MLVLCSSFRCRGSPSAACVASAQQCASDSPDPGQTTQSYKSVIVVVVLGKVLGKLVIYQIKVTFEKSYFIFRPIFSLFIFKKDYVKWGSKDFFQPQVILHFEHFVTKRGLERA